MDLSSSEGGHARGGVRRYSEGHQKEVEYGCAIHCDTTDSGPLGEGHAEDGGEGVPAVVGSRGDRPLGGKGKGGGIHSNGFGIIFGI